MAKIEEMTVTVLCNPRNIDKVKAICRTQDVTPKEKEGPMGSTALEMTAHIPTLFQIAYQCGESNIGITVG